jgi:hypothetical protein
VIQTVSEEADHAHSGCVETATVVVAPPAVTGSGGVSVTAHFAGEGPVDVATVEPHPPAAQANTHAATYTSAVVDRRREGRLESGRMGKRIPWSIGGLPTPESKISVGVVLRRQISGRERSNAADEQPPCLLRSS